MKKNRITISVHNRNPVHTRLSIWVNGGLITSSGGVCLRNEEIEDFVNRLNPENKDVVLNNLKIKKYDT